MAKVLIIDDEPDMVEFVASVVVSLGHDAEGATSLRGLASAHLSQFDICFLDLYMPDLDGIEVLRFLADNKTQASIVFMSGGKHAVLNAARELAGC